MWAKAAQGEPPAGGRRHLALAGRSSSSTGRVVGRGADEDGDVLVGLGSGAHHGRTADVDHLDRRVRAERVEVAGDEVDRPDPLLLEVGHVLGLGAVGEDPAVHDRVQRLDTPAEHLRRPRQVGDADVGDARLGQGARAVFPLATSSQPSSSSPLAGTLPGRSCR